MTDTSPTILLVEDNNDDVFLMRRALKASRVKNPLQVAVHGRQALDYLAGTAAYADRACYPLPFVIFLDLKLPYLDGFELLTWLRQQSHLQSIIVVVLTSSAESRDQERSYALGAKSYLVKPPTAETLNTVFDSLNMREKLVAAG
jgi:CheY-like chemotaxis protein